MIELLNTKWAKNPYYECRDGVKSNPINLEASHLMETILKSIHTNQPNHTPPESVLERAADKLGLVNIANEKKKARAEARARAKAEARARVREKASVPAPEPTPYHEPTTTPLLDYLTTTELITNEINEVTDDPKATQTKMQLAPETEKEAVLRGEVVYICTIIKDKVNKLNDEHKNKCREWMRRKEFC